MKNRSKLKLRGVRFHMPTNTTTQRSPITYTAPGVTPQRVLANLGTCELVEHAIRRNEGQLTDRGAFTAITSPHTGRSPKDKFVVDEPGSTSQIWWDKNEKISEAHFDKLFDLNVKGTVFTVQKALTLINDGGSIVLIGSVASVKGTPAFGTYGATKAAVRNLVRTWTMELKDRRIRSNVLSPGPIRTALVDQQPPEAIARMVATIPMGRMGEPDEVAKAAVFLASDDSSFVTGIELFVDGGRGQV